MRMEAARTRFVDAQADMRVNSLPASARKRKRSPSNTVEVRKMNRWLFAAILGLVAAMAAAVDAGEFHSRALRHSRPAAGVAVYVVPADGFRDGPIDVAMVADRAVGLAVSGTDGSLRFSLPSRGPWLMIAVGRRAVRSLVFFAGDSLPIQVEGTGE
jgi:hypothetical protein